MGKQKRSRRNKNREQQGGKSNKPKVTDETDNKEKPSSILLKIRHADPNTRLAALTALLDHPNHRNMALWQAVREQVMDTNLTVASMAATCLEEFLLLPPPPPPPNNQQSTTASVESPDLATAGWYLILLGRIQEAHAKVLTDAGDSSMKSKPEKNSNQKQQWLSLALACLSTMTSLVQENPVVCERLERTSSLRRDSFEVLWKWICYTLSEHKPVDEEAIIVSYKRQIQEQVSDLLHILMEDNPGVVEPWYEEETAAAQAILKSAWDLVQVDHSAASSHAAAAASRLSPLSRLHLVGILLSAFSQLPPLLDDADANGWAPRPLLESLKSFLQLPEESTTQHNKSSLWQAYQNAQQQQQDSTLETNVLIQQNIKKEPARAIARRLKQNQQQSSMATDDGDGKTAKSGTLQENRTDHVQEWQSLLDNWRRQHVVLELALEMTANLTSGLGFPTAKGNDQDSDWMQVEKGPIDSIICEVFQSEIPALHRLLNQFTEHLALTPTTGGEEWPPVIRQHWLELQSKAAACLSHLLAMRAAARKATDKDSTMNTSDENSLLLSLWRDLVRALENKQPAVVGTMVVALQSQPQLLSSGAVLPSDVNLFLTILEQSCISSTAESSATVGSSRPTEDDLQTFVLCRDLIMLVGMILCQQKHSREMNHRVCQSLLKAGVSVSSVSVVAESLNTLMDIYGDDDCHPDVFDELRVLQHFQMSLPSLKQKLSISTHQDNSDSEYIQEVVSNASSFIQYKKGH